MNKPKNATPLLKWLETHSLVNKGTTEAVNTLAGKWKEFTDSLKSAGVIR